jgi:uncharacterized membrane protein YagU involved in acid resistance
MKAYVIKSLYVSEQTPGANGNYIHIAGRASGFVAWLLSSMGISPTVELSLKTNKILFSEGSLFGFRESHTPLEKICSTYYGYKKPWMEALIIGFIVCSVCLVILEPNYKYLGLVGGIVAGILIYYLNKTLMFGFSASSGEKHEIHFKPSVIEGKNIDEASVAEICRIIQDRIEMYLHTANAPSSLISKNQLKYFYADTHSQPQGPFSYDELANLEKLGTINSDTKVIIEGAADWDVWGKIKSEGRR